VALAAIQGLHQLLQDKDARIAALEKELVEVRTDMFARVAAIEEAIGQFKATIRPDGSSAAPSAAHPNTTAVDAR
jgi:hypothetical protein